MNKNIEINGAELRTDEELGLLVAIIGQKEIGWNAMLQGFVHVRWARSQQKHMTSTGQETKKSNIKQWKQMLVKTLTAYSLNCWKFRNEQLHGKTEKEGRKKNRSITKTGKIPI